jgi:hypothetical protein
MEGGLKISEFADGVAATAATLGVAAAASGIGLPLVPVLEGVALGSKAGSVITDLFGDGLSATQVVAAAQNLRENSYANQLFQQRLFRREQAADVQFVSSLEHAAHDSFKSTPRRSKGQKITPAQHSRGQLKYYHGPQFHT